jgi:NAD(P)-dependent dehydrogenase (short-subunit alcohol dehydrogenase family)
MKLDGRVALVTGATSGIGRATAALFAREGARVALMGRDAKRGQDAVAVTEQAGGQAMFVAGDVRWSDQCRNAVEQTTRAYGRLDILFNNAGVYFPRSVPEMTEEEWDDTIDVSLKGAFLMSKYALPVMIAQQSGVIVHNSSGWGIQGGDKAAAYCAAKGGLIVMAKAMAIDHGRQGIRVNCVCPGDVDTPMLPAEAKMRGVDWETYWAGCANRPLGRVGTVDDIAKAVLFLACDDSAFMTGAALVVDGGGVAD